MEPLDGEFAAGGLAILQYLIDLFTMSGHSAFSREQVLVILNAVMHDPELFMPHQVAAFQRASDEIDGAESGIEP